MRILVLQGPNLNMLGKREAGHYGTLTLDEIHKKLSDRAKSLSCELVFYQSNHEGDLVDRIQSERGCVGGMILNPAGLTAFAAAMSMVRTRSQPGVIWSIIVSGFPTR